MHTPRRARKYSSAKTFAMFAGHCRCGCLKPSLKKWHRGKFRRFSSHKTKTRRYCYGNSYIPTFSVHWLSSLRMVPQHRLPTRAPSRAGEPLRRGARADPAFFRAAARPPAAVRRTGPPSLFLGALWLPYKRGAAALVDLLRRAICEKQLCLYARSRAYTHTLRRTYTFYSAA